MIGKAEIIVRTDHDHFAAIHDNLRILSTFDGPEIRIEAMGNEYLCFIEFKTLAEYVC